MTLKEDLAELSQVLPLVPNEVNELAQSLHDLVDATSALLADVATARQELTELLTELRNTLPSLAVQLETLEKRVDAAADAAEKAWTEATGELDLAEKTLHAAEERVDQARQDLAKGLVDAATTVAEGGAQGDSAMVEIESVASKAEDELKAATGALHDQVVALETLLDGAVQALGEAAGDLKEAAEQFARNGDADTEAILEHLAIRLTGYSEQVEELVKDVAYENETILTPFEPWLHDSVGTPLGLAGETLGIELDALAAAAASQQEAARAARDGHGTAVGDLTAEAQPAARAVLEIHEAVKRMRQS